MKSFFVGLSGILAGIYLLNPTLGLFELIPDAVPLVGNLDEATAMTIVLASLSYFGVDLTKFFKRKDKK